MRPLVSALVVLLAPAALAQAQQLRDVTVGVSGEGGAPVHDLRPDEFSVAENGEPRELVGVARDQRPIDVALILDTSESMREDYRPTIVPAAMELVRSLPEWARLTIWTSGGRSFQAVKFDAAPHEAEQALQQVATGGVRFTLHTLVDAVKHFDERRPARRVVVIVTGELIPYEKDVIRDAAKVVPEAHVMPIVILVKRGTSTRIGGTGISWEVEPFFRGMAKDYGGSLDVVTSALSVGGLLRRTASELTSQYLVRFESDAEHPFQPQVEVAREGVHVLAGLAMRAAQD